MRAHDLCTLWSDIFIKDRIVTSCGSFLQRRNYLRREKIMDVASQLELILHRTFSMRSVHQGSVTLSTQQRVVHFGDYELFLIELCSGKLTIREIADRAYVYIGGSREIEAVRREVCDFLASLSRELLLVFRVFGPAGKGPTNCGNRRLAVQDQAAFVGALTAAGE